MNMPTAPEVFGGPSEPAATFSVVDGRYTYAALDGAISFIVDHVRRERHYLIGEVEVRCYLAGARTYGDGRDTLLISHLNLSSARAKQDFGRLLADRARTSDVDWVGHLEDCSQRIWLEDRRGSPAVPLHEVPRPNADAAIDVLGFRLLRHHPQMLFSPGGTGKSLLASAIIGELGKRGIRTLLLDWEMDGGEQRLRADALGLPPTVLYQRCDQPLDVLAEAIRRTVLEQQVGFLLIDSVAPACTGRVEDAEVAIEFFKALRRIGTMGTLAIAHTRAEDGEQRPFGSVFWHNLARSTWFLKRVSESASDSIILGVYHRKANFGPLRPAFGLEIRLDAPDGTLENATVVRTDITDVTELAKGLPAWQRIRHALRHQPKTQVELAEECDVSVEAVKKAFQRDGGRLFTLVPKTADGVQRWALVDRRLA
jgi:hypothetical protein